MRNSGKFFSAIRRGTISPFEVCFGLENCTDLAPGFTCEPDREKFCPSWPPLQMKSKTTATEKELEESAATAASPTASVAAFLFRMRFFEAQKTVHKDGFQASLGALALVPGSSGGKREL